MNAMGLAVLQQFSEYDNLYQQGMLAALFEEAGGEFKQEAPALRLVDISHVEGNLTHAATSIALAPHSDEERNITPHDKHDKEITHKYSLHDLGAAISAIEGPGNDDNISTKIARIKPTNANQEGANARKNIQRSNDSMRLMFAEEMRRQNEYQIELERRIQSLRAISDELDNLTDEDLDQNTAEGRKRKDDIQKRLVENGSKIILDDYKKADGTIDRKEAQKAIDEEARGLENLLASSQIADAPAANEPSYAKEQIAVALEPIDDNTMSFDQLGFGDLQDLTSAEPLHANVSLIHDNRSYSSVAANMDGGNTCVISNTFNSSSAGTQTIQPDVQIAPAAAPAQRNSMGMTA